MGATKNLGLTQFEPDTVTNWLDQYNKDMKKIDDYVGDENVAGAALEERLTTDETNIENNRNQINENTQDIANILNDISEIEGGESGASLKSLNERTTALETGLQTATTDITTVTNKADATAIEVETIDSRLGTVEDDVEGLSRVIGNSPLSNGKTITSLIGNTPLYESGDTITKKVSDLTRSSIYSPVTFASMNIGGAVYEVPIVFNFANHVFSLSLTVALPAITRNESITIKIHSPLFKNYRYANPLNNVFNCLQIGDPTYGTMTQLTPHMLLETTNTNEKDVIFTLPVGVDIQKTILSLFTIIALSN